MLTFKLPRAPTEFSRFQSQKRTHDQVTDRQSMVFPGAAETLYCSTLLMSAVTACSLLHEEPCQTSRGLALVCGITVQVNAKPCGSCLLNHLPSGRLTGDHGGLSRARVSVLPHGVVYSFWLPCPMRSHLDVKLKGPSKK